MTSERRVEKVPHHSGTSQGLVIIDAAHTCMQVFKVAATGDMSSIPML